MATLALLNSLNLQAAIMIFINFLNLAYVMRVQPFEDAKENANNIISEGAVMITSLSLPLLIVGYSTERVADILVQILLSLTMLSAVVSMAFLVKAIVQNCKKKES